VIVAVMKIGVMRMPVNKRRMPVPMGVRLAGRHAGRMVVLMMVVVPVAVFMLHRLMGMFVLMPFREMQPQTKPHEPAREK
jgi:hypothetical protein